MSVRNWRRQASFAVLAFCCVAVHAAEAPFAWQQDYARVTEGGAIDFLRIAHGTLADAHTSIQELYAWQFDGPAERDMRGVKPLGKGRDAGAIESF
jgi:hypothetical protein